MKLLFIGNTAWSMYNFRRPVFIYFLKQGYEIIILAPKDNTYDKLLESIGCKFYPIAIDSKGKNPIKDLLTLFSIKEIMKKEKPDYCFFYTIKPNIYGSLAARLLNIPYIPITTGLGYIFSVNNWISNISKLLYKIAFKKAKKVCFLNKEDANTFINEKLIPENQVIIFNGEGIDVTKFNLESNPKDISFILIARIIWDKGVKEFVQAAQLIKQKYPLTKFKLLGFLGVDNPNAISKEQINIWEKEGIIEYLGSTNDVRPYINSSTCVVLPSYYREGIPFCLMEGAASGKPIITTRNIGCKEVVEDGVTGFLCDIKDPITLSQCMEKIILMSDKERNEMGLKGRKKMENEFDIKLIIEKYKNIINFNE